MLLDCEGRLGRRKLGGQRIRARSGRELRIAAFS